jgi:DNA polymerase III alpha subunit
MANIAVEDQYSSIDVVVFPRSYSNYSKQLVEGSVVEITGRVTIDEYGKQLILDTIRIIE